MEVLTVYRIRHLVGLAAHVTEKDNSAQLFKRMIAEAEEFDVKLDGLEARERRVRDWIAQFEATDPVRHHRLQPILAILNGAAE